MSYRSQSHVLPCTVSALKHSFCKYLLTSVCYTELLASKDGNRNSSVHCSVVYLASQEDLALFSSQAGPGGSLFIYLILFIYRLPFMWIMNPHRFFPCSLNFYIALVKLSIMREITFNACSSHSNTNKHLCSLLESAGREDTSHKTANCHFETQLVMDRLPDCSGS